MLFCKSDGILFSPFDLQSTWTPSELVVHLQTLGHDAATPTNKTRPNIAAINNCILSRQSTNTKAKQIKKKHLYK